MAKTTPSDTGIIPPGSNAAYAVETAPTPPPDYTGPDYNAITTPQQWAQLLLATMRLPTTPSNIAFLVSWAQREGGNWHNTARFNPLNTTWRDPTGKIKSRVMSGGNTAGVQAYADWASGIQATVQTLQHYSQIISALQTGDAGRVDITGGMTQDLSRWSGGGYTQVNIGPYNPNGPGGGGQPQTSGPGLPFSGAAGATTTGGVAGATGGPSPAQTTIGAIGEAEAQKRFPELAWMLTIPDIARDVRGWAAVNQSPEQIAAQLAGTDWYKRLGATFFTQIAEQSTNPTVAKQNLDEARAVITQQFQQMGLQPTTAQIDTFAYQYLAQDWGAADRAGLMQQALADTVATNPDGTFSVKNYNIDPTGKLVTTFIGPNGQTSFNPQDFQTTLDPSAIQSGFVQQYATAGSDTSGILPGAPVYILEGNKLHQGFDPHKLAKGTPLYTLPNAITAQRGSAQTGPESTMSGILQSAQQLATQAAADYLVPFSGAEAAQLVQQSVQMGLTGQGLADHFKAYFQAHAKGLYPSMSAAIDAGITPRAYVAPYQSVVARALGITPDQVNMEDPKYMRLITQKDDKGMPVAMSLYDAQNLVMKDPIYGYMNSRDAAQRASALAQGIGELFGKTPSLPSGFGGVAAPALPL